MLRETCDEAGADTNRSSVEHGGNLGCRVRKVDVKKESQASAWQHFVDIGASEIIAGQRLLYPCTSLFNQENYVNTFTDVFVAVFTSSFTPSLRSVLIDKYEIASSMSKLYFLLKNELVYNIINK